MTLRKDTTGYSFLDEDANGFKKTIKDIPALREFLGMTERNGVSRFHVPGASENGAYVWKEDNIRGWMRQNQETLEVSRVFEFPLRRVTILIASGCDHALDNGRSESSDRVCEYEVLRGDVYNAKLANLQQHGYDNLHVLQDAVEWLRARVGGKVLSP